MDTTLTDKLVLPTAEGRPVGSYHEASGGGGYATAATAEGGGGGGAPKGEKQPSQCRDPIFAFLFYVQLAAVMGVAVSLGVPAVKDAAAGSSSSSSSYHDDTTSSSSSGLVRMIIMAGAFASLFSGGALLVLMKHAATLIQISLTFGMGMSLAMAIVALLAGQVGAFVMCMIFFAINACYAYYVWSRIPFAAANLNTAVAGIKSNLGISLVAYGMVAVAFLYTSIWSLALFGAYYKSAGCVKGQCQDDPNSGYVFLLLLAYFWTQQVIQNTVHVTVAGTVGTWWFDPLEANSCFSSAVTESFYRATTLSFGSICMGSLLVAIIQTLRQIAQNARNSDRDNDNLLGTILLCIAQCILQFLEDIVQYFNKWAYVYVGLYGYPYMTAGQKVMELFQYRGWETIISFDLVSGALFMASLAVGLVTGFVGYLIHWMNPAAFATLDDSSGVMAFLISFIIGLLISSVMMSVVSSGVNTVIVCFAEAPEELQANHPQLSEEMRVAWRGTYPTLCDF